MTFIASEGAANEVVLRAQHAHFRSDSESVELEGVEAVVAASPERMGFEMECDRGELDFVTNDFFAQGRVKGRTDGGREFRSDWVRYDHAQGLLFTDTTVHIREEGGAGTYRGGGFRYYVREGRFKLMGGATVVQEVQEEPGS